MEMNWLSWLSAGLFLGTIFNIIVVEKFMPSSRLLEIYHKAIAREEYKAKVREIKRLRGTKRQHSEEVK